MLNAAFSVAFAVTLFMFGWYYSKWSRERKK